jgi:hypothetical protein
MKLAQIFFFQHFKNKIVFNFVKLEATKKDMTTNFFHPPLLLLFLDTYGIRDKHPGSATLLGRLFKIYLAIFLR